jgi:hypothetical protein
MRGSESCGGTRVASKLIGSMQRRFAMKKAITFAAIVAFAATLIGCHASADVDPHGTTSVISPR